jgi:hypothetical protein
VLDGWKGTGNHNNHNKNEGCNCAMRGKKATLKAEEAEFYQPLKVKTSGTQQNLYEKMRVLDDGGAPKGRDSKNPNVRVGQAATGKSPKAAATDNRAKGPFGRLVSASTSSKRGKSGREATVVMVSARPRRGAGAAVVGVNATSTTPNAARLPPSPPRTDSPPQQPTPPSSRTSGSRAPRTAAPSAPGQTDASMGREANQARRHDAPAKTNAATVPTAVTTATKTTTISPGVKGNAKFNADKQPPVSTVNPEGALPVPVSPTTPVFQAGQTKIQQEDWLSMLIPDDKPGLATGTAARATPEGEFATNRPAAVVAVDFSHNDFATMFDGHNDSDSIIWDPHAEVMASFPGFSVAHDVMEAPAVDRTFVRESDAMMHEEANMSSMLANDALQFLQVSDPKNIPAKTKQDTSQKPETEGGPIFREHGPPMSTVLVCKVTATTTTATTTSQSSSSSSSNSSTSSKEGRDDCDEDGVSDMETDGVEDAAANAPGRAAMVPNEGGGRIPPRPTQLQQPTHVPPTEPTCEVRERRLSFSSLQMMLDKHSMHRTNGAAAADNESLEDFFRDDDSLLNDDEEIDPGPIMDGREDTYSFIGADYSFGADRSLISLLP